MEVVKFENYIVTVDEKEIDRLFESNPFNLPKNYRDLHIGEDEKLDIQEDIKEELAKGGPRRGGGFRPVVGDMYHGVFVADIRIGTESGGKREGYRTFNLVLPFYRRAYLLGIIRHEHKSEDTTLTSSAKAALKSIVDDLDEQVQNCSKRK